MNRQEKEQVIQSLKDSFSASQAAFLVGYKGLSVKEVQTLRRKLRDQGGTFKVTKARLMKLAAEGVTGVQDLTPYFKEQVALVFAQKDVAPIAKTLIDFAKEHKALSVVAGSAEQSLLDNRAIVFMATLPSREILLAQLCGVLMAPAASLARVINSVKEQKEQHAEKAA
jgi:large subunit ribosomal protein L10